MAYRTQICYKNGVYFMLPIMVYPLDSVQPNPKTNPLIYHNVRWGDMR